MIYLNFHPKLPGSSKLTHWGRVTHICVSKLTIIDISDNGLSAGRRQAIIWTNAGILLIGPLGTNVSENLIEIYTFSFKKMHLNMLFGKWRPCCLSLNVLTMLLPFVSGWHTWGWWPWYCEPYQLHGYFCMKFGFSEIQNDGIFFKIYLEILKHLKINYHCHISFSTIVTVCAKNTNVCSET